MRFTKDDVLQTFDRKETSYRLSYLCTLWLRNTSHFKPSAADEARGLRMQARGQWVTYTDIADKLERQSDLNAIVSDFNLTQLHTLIRAPLEVLRDYCEDYDEESRTSALCERLRGMPWYWFASVVRNAVSHNYRYEFNKSDLKRLPLTWRGATLSAEMQGQAVDYQTFWHKEGCELFLEMQDFALALPVIPAGQ